LSNKKELDAEDIDRVLSGLIVPVIAFGTKKARNALFSCTARKLWLSFFPRPVMNIHRSLRTLDDREVCR